MAAEKGIDRKKADVATTVSRRGSRLPWPLLAVNFALMAIILVAGFLYTRRQISRIKIDKMNELRAIAALKTNQIKHWLDEILDDGRFLRSSMNFNAMFIEKLKIKPADFQKFLSTWIKALKDSEGSGEIRFLHLQVRPIWPAAEETKPADPALVSKLQTVFAAGDVSLFDLYFSKTLNRINLSLRVPIFTFSVFGQVLQAALLFSVDPSQFLFPLIQSWPTASPSAETLLVRREGEDVVYLNELRHRQNTALRLRFPIAKKGIPAARAARGEVGFVTGLDYRGVPVFADIHRIPGTSWSLIAKIDQSEIYDLVARQEWVMLVLVISVFLVILLFSAYSWRQQQVSYLRRQVNTDAALRQSEERYRQLVENQGEGICIVNQDENFIFVNPAAEEIFGVPPGTLAGRNLKEFLPVDELSRLKEQNRKRAQGEKGSYELRIRRPDGAERVLLITAMPLKDPQGEVSGTFGIFRDISDRKRAELVECALYEISRAPETAKSLDDLYHAVHLIIKSLMPAENFYVALYDEEANLLHFPYYADEIDTSPPAQKPGKNLTGYVLRTGRTLLCDATLDEEMTHRGEVEMEGAPSACWLGAPLKVDEKIVGVIALQHYSDPLAYGEQEKQVLDFVSGQVANTIERKRDEEKIRKMLAEKELLLKEVHHRVKNNMMVIASLLQIQAQRVSDQKTITVLQESQNRIRAMMAIYEKLYQTTDLSHIDLKGYFTELTRSLFAAYNVRPEKIELEIAISDIVLDIDRTIPCGLIINELVSNTLKYAFPGDRKGRIKIEFSEIKVGGRGTSPFRDKSRCAPTTEQDQVPMYTLTVANDGVPLPAGFDITKNTGFGLQLVNMLAGQLGGKLQVYSREWMEFQVTFPQNYS